MLQYGAPEYFDYLKYKKSGKKKRPKKERKNKGKKKTHSGFHPGFKHFSCGNSLKAMISFQILKFT